MSVRADRDRILVTGLRVLARHGVLPHEREHGQLFVVDLDLDVDLGPAGASDRLADTVDYADLVGRVAALIEGESRSLIEALAGDIARLVLADERVRSVRVRVAKPQALLGRDGQVAAEVVRAQGDS